MATNFNANPFYDDYDPSKKFHRILFRPGKAVQARELTQLQTILQKQIERVGDHLFEDGSVVTGCNYNLELGLKFVRINDTFSSSNVNVALFANASVRSANSGVLAKIINTSNTAGSKSLYVKYLTPGTVVLTLGGSANTFIANNRISSSGGANARIVAWDATTKKLFLAANTAAFTTAHTLTSNSGSGETGTSITSNITAVSDSRLVKEFANNDVLFATGARAQAISNGAGTYILGSNTYQYASQFTVGEGVVYSNGFFVLVDRQAVILNKFRNDPTIKVGLQINESIVTENDDTSLLDNAQGTSNFAAEGAHRYKIDPVLITESFEANTARPDFIELLKIKDGVSLSPPSAETTYGPIQKEFARRTSDVSGNFATRPFILRVREHLSQNSNGGRYTANNNGNVNLLDLEVEPGEAYVSGKRYTKYYPEHLNIQKGIDYNTVESVSVTANFGNYVKVKEVAGSWDVNTLSQIDLYNVPVGAYSNNFVSANTSIVGGTKVGTARVRSIEYESGNPGTANAQYRLYLFDLSFTGNNGFSDVRSIYDSNNVNRFADVVLANGQARLDETSFNRLVFKTPYNAIKRIRDADGNIETSFRFRKRYSATFTSGVASLASTDENERFIGSGLQNATQKNSNYYVVVTNSGSNVTTPALDGTVTVVAANTSVGGSGTNFDTQVNVGDFLTINGETIKVASITSATALTLATAHSAGAVANAYVKTIKPGTVLNMGGYGEAGARTVTVSSPSSVSIDTKEGVTFTGDIIVSMDRTNARETRKILQSNTSVAINPATHTNGFSGPYGLGKSDVFQIRAIYESSGTGVAATTSDTNVTANYDLDNGQRDNFYRHGAIKLKANARGPQGRLLVLFDYFTHDTTQGLGYFSVDSYPIDDTNFANTTAISTNTIPSFTTSQGSLIKLRDAIDFRPRLTDSVLTSNPVEGSTFTTPLGGAHIPVPNSDLSADLEYYLSRVDRLVLNDEGDYEVIKGSPAVNPVTPAPPQLGMSIALLRIPPYPSAPTNVNVDRVTTRRYTMDDIGKLDERLKRVEYYTALTLLEKETADKKFLDENGLDRFKNGILADHFTGHGVSDVTNIDYAASIDPQKRECRPMFEIRNIDFDLSSSGLTNARRVGDMVIMDYTETSYANNVSATEPINVVDALTFNWVGEMELDPPSDNWTDTTRLADVQVNFNGNYDAWASLAGAWGTQWNGWQTEHVSSTHHTSATGAGNDIDVTQFTEQQSRSGTSLDVSSETVSQRIGERLVNVNIRPYMRTRDVRFHAIRMKPDTRVYAFFDTEDVGVNVKQIEAVANTQAVTFSDDNFITAGITDKTAFGGDLYTDESGEIHGVFRVPAGRFRNGTRAFRLSDDSQNRDNFVTTSATENFTAMGIIQDTQDTVISMREVRLGVQSHTQSRTAVYQHVGLAPSVLPPNGPAPVNPAGAVRF